MRVNPDVNASLLANLNLMNSSQQKLLGELSSGLRVQRPSDDPATAAALVELKSDDAGTQQSISNAKAMGMQMQAADSALNSVGTVLQRALTLGVEGATGTLSDADRNALGEELKGIKDQLLQLANSSLRGVYLFAGTASSVQPYVADNTKPSGVRYDGNSSTNQVEIGDGYWIDANLAGTRIFGDGTSGTFKALNDLITAVQNNTGVDAANSQVQSAIDQVSVARVQYGNAMNQLSTSQSIMDDRHIQLQQQVENLSAADMTKTASDLVSVETSRTALLDVIAKSNRVSLFDYLSNS